MKIIVLNGSPRPSGNTKAMISAFTEGAERAGHEVTAFDVCRMSIKGCLACEYCHTKAFQQCVQKDDMQKIYPILDEAEMIYWRHRFTTMAFPGSSSALLTVSMRRGIRKS